ncbi:MAG: hypothetical protein ACSLFN_09600 [Candidatus Limnocylindrales bacterium]
MTASSREFAGNWPGWPREMNLLGWKALLGDGAGRADVSPYGAPARATDLSNLLPAYTRVPQLNASEGMQTAPDEHDMGRRMGSEEPIGDEIPQAGLVIGKPAVELGDGLRVVARFPAAHARTLHVVVC